MLLFKSLVAWLLILCLAVANGALREAVLIPSLGKSSGFILSGVLLSVVVMLVAYAFVGLKQGITISQGFSVGVLWLCLTLAFEFSFGYCVQHKSCAELLGAYTFEDGNLWSVVLLMTLLAPYLAALAQAKSRQAKMVVGRFRVSKCQYKKLWRIAYRRIHLTNLRTSNKFADYNFVAKRI